MPPTEEQIVRRLLTAIDEDARVSQRSLSQEIGVALGSINWYLKRSVRKGYIKLQEAPVRRYLYYLTPKGFEEKARLTAAFLQSSLDLYRTGRMECAQFFGDCVSNGNHNVYLAGDGDFAEIAVSSSFDIGLKPVAVVDDLAKRDSCLGVSVLASFNVAVVRRKLGLPNAILLTDLGNPKGAYHATVAEISALGLSPEVIHVPRILNFKPRP